MGLVRLAREAELPEGGKIVKETYGRKILLARAGGKVFATDAHCFHMGGNLWEGDIEDVGGKTCVVCPLHRYKIDMCTGQKVDTMLDGCVTCSSSQQQRTYAVHPDDGFIWIDIPELHAQKPLPSDRYNQVAPGMPRSGPFQQTGSGSGGMPSRANYGLFGSSSSSRPSAPEPLAPYAGFHQRSLIPGTPAKDMMEDEPALQLSQESGIQLSQEAPAQQPQQFQMQQQPQHVPQGQIPFAQSRVDTARIARRKAATAAIAARAYTPPSAPPLHQPPASRGLFSTGSTLAQQQQQQQQTPAGLARTTSNGGQQSLFAYGFTTQPRPAVSVGPEAMDME